MTENTAERESEDLRSSACGSLGDRSSRRDDRDGKSKICRKTTESEVTFYDTGVDLDNYSVTVLAITGAPCAGKSTVVDLLRDMGIPCKDTGDAIRDEAHERYDGSKDSPDEDYIWNTAKLIRDEHGPEGPTKITKDWIKTQRAHGHTLVCIASLRDQAEVDWLRENVGPTLVCRITANDHARSERYVESKLDETDREAVSRERVQELRSELYERELREQPYPAHDVQIRNENDVSTRELWSKLDSLTTVLRA